MFQPGNNATAAASAACRPRPRKQLFAQTQSYYVVTFIRRPANRAVKTEGNTACAAIQNDTLHLPTVDIELPPRQRRSILKSRVDLTSAEIC